MWKLYCKLVDINNRKVDKEMDDYYFLRDLCTQNHTLNLNKYSRLMSMVKRKYRKQLKSVDN